MVSPSPTKKRCQIPLTISLQQLLKKKTKENINPSHKHFPDFLKNRTQTFFFLTPTNKSEIQNISSHDSNKSVRPSRIPTKIIKLFKLFNISFSTGAFPTILKVAKVVPVYKKLQIRLFKLLVNCTII